MSIRSDGSRPSPWRFSMELLSNVHTLQVSLLPSSPQLHPARDCANVEATLLSAPPALSILWYPAHEEAPVNFLRLLLPVLIFDYSLPPRISALADCIQLSLCLLPIPPIHLHALSSLPLDGTGPSKIPGAAQAPIKADVCILANMEGPNGEEVDNEDQYFEKSAISESSQFKSCAEHVMSRYESSSIEHDRNHDAMPPTHVGTYADVVYDVEDIHDIKQCAYNSFGDGHAQSLDSKSLNEGVYDYDTHKVLEGDGVYCVRGHTSNNDVFGYNGVIRDDVYDEVHDACIHNVRSQGRARSSNGHSLLSIYQSCKSGAVEPSKGSEDHSSQGTASFMCKNCLTKVSMRPVRSFMQLPCFDWREVVENWFGACCCSFGSAAEVLSVSFEKSLQLHPEKCLMGPSTFYVHFSDVTVREYLVSLGNEANAWQLPTSSFLAFGNGFMVWENQYSKTCKWIPVNCSSCGSVLGVYPCTVTDFGLSREGLHLFRCQIITCKTDGTAHHANRDETFNDLLVRELKQRTDENSCHRFLIRSLSSELPLLQLVVLSYESLTCMGIVNAFAEKHSQCISNYADFLNKVRLQRSTKVLFLDCSRVLEDNARTAQLWAKEHDAETVFMLEEFAHKLRDELLAKSMFCPAECGLFKGFMGAFL